MTGRATTGHSKTSRPSPARPRPARRAPTTTASTGDAAPPASDADGAAPTPDRAGPPRSGPNDDLAYQVWLELRTDARNTTPHRRGGVPGQLWHGKLDTAVDQSLATATGGAAGEVPAATIITALTRRGALAFSGPAVWIADQWPTRATPSPTSVSRSEADATSPEPASRPASRSGRTSRRRRAGYPCRKCAFVGLTPQAIGRHTKGFFGRPHPTASYPCPHPGCPSVAVVAETARHHRRVCHPGEVTNPPGQQAAEISSPGARSSAGVSTPATDSAATDSAATDSAAPDSAATDSAATDSAATDAAAASDPYANLRRLLAGNDEAIHLVRKALAASEQTTELLKAALQQLTG